MALIILLSLQLAICALGLFSFFKFKKDIFKKIAALDQDIRIASKMATHTALKIDEMDDGFTHSNYRPGDGPEIIYLFWG
jgi:hypothetical protein